MDVCINMWHVFLGAFRFALQHKNKKNKHFLVDKNTNTIRK